MIRVADLLRISARQVIRQRGRYLGVVLSITLGTLAFIVISTMGRDVKENLNRDLDLLGGATLIKLHLDQSLVEGREERLRDESVEAVRALPGVVGVSRLAIKKCPAYTACNDQEHSYVLVGVDRFFWEVNSFAAMAGELFGAEDIAARRRVCVLGAGLARRVFGEGEAVGRHLPIDGDLYLVVGVLEGVGVGDRTQFAFLPLTTAQDRIAALSAPNRLYVRCRTWDDVEPVAEAIPAAVAQHQPAGRLRVEVGREQLRHVRRIAWWIKLFICVSIAATLSLGGYGIWNGMMTAVRARTREIGLKKAMGAADGDIMFQFLTEALCLSLGSALLGVILSRVGIQAISHLLGAPPREHLFMLCVGLSLLFSVLLGVGAGFVPSLRASRMEVVSAMRYE